MNEQELLQAFSRVDRGFVEEAEQPVTRKSPVLLRVTASLAAVAAACAGIYFGMRWLGRQQGITYSPGYSDNMIESAMTVTQTSAAADETVQTTVSTAHTPETVSTAHTPETVTQTESALTTAKTASGTQETGNTTGTAPANETSLPISKATVPKTTEPAQSTSVTTAAPEQADPDQVIQQLKTGYLHGFDWDAQRVYASNKVVPHQVCEIDYVPYGVAFLCRDSDLEALKTGSIGQYPVNWSEGAWTDAGGSGIGYVNGASADNCLVQPVSGFVYQYGGDNATEMSGTGHSFSFRYDQQTQCRVMNDFSEFAQDGWTVCMASAEAEICATPSGSAYRDYSALIGALAAKPETVLLGIVYGEELSFGDPEPSFFELNVHVTGGQPALDALSAYGTVHERQGISDWLGEFHMDYSSEHGWYQLELSKEKKDEIEARVGFMLELGDWNDAIRQEFQALCEELMQIPGVRLAQPYMSFFAG